MIINIEQYAIKSLIIACILRPNCSEWSCVRLVRPRTQPGCVLITVMLLCNLTTTALPTIRTRGMTRSLIEHFLVGEAWQLNLQTFMTETRTFLALVWPWRSCPRFLVVHGSHTLLWLWTCLLSRFNRTRASTLPVMQRREIPRWLSQQVRFPLRS